MKKNIFISIVKKLRRNVGVNGGFWQRDFPRRESGQAAQGVNAGRDHVRAVLRVCTWGLVCFLAVAGCGYTTRGFVYKEGTIYINPVVNKSNIAHEKRAYSSYNVYPILLEKRLTNILIDKFNIDGSLRVSNSKSNSLSLQCEIRNYNKEALRYTDSDNVTEQRLRLYVHCTLRSENGEILKEKDVVGETTYFLSGKLAKSESTAQTDLVNDAARRIVETVVEEW